MQMSPQLRRILKAFLKAMGALFALPLLYFTGATGTNISDLRILLTPP